MASKTFITAVGRRKTAIASVRLIAGTDDTILVNGKPALAYFKTAERADTVAEPLKIAETAKVYSVMSHVEGGGIAAQADALRHAISRAIIKSEPTTRKVLKAAGFLMRDPRAKERKKPGLVKARKRKQWSKR